MNHFIKYLKLCHTQDVNGEAQCLCVCNQLSRNFTITNFVSVDQIVFSPATCPCNKASQSEMRLCDCHVISEICLLSIERLFFLLVTVRWEKTDMAKLSYNHRLELAKLLAPSSLKDWKSLAGELGFDCVEIRNLAMQKGYDCVMKMFEAYECMEYASIQHLYDKLISIQRHDAAKVLEPYKSVSYSFLNISKLPKCSFSLRLCLCYC